ncbi:MAG: hypothetical protein CVV03_01470 [Firmicutes bacterium HGW-Firmicutes-8]|nr:MAG: hypothetical protein CVV03_01470 [Firmicutes bacterium HGW-Firmicutes-8]
MCDEGPVKVRVWFKENGKDLNFPAWTNTVEEIQAMKIAGFVKVHDIKYEIKEMCFDTGIEAIVFDLERA